MTKTKYFSKKIREILFFFFGVAGWKKRFFPYVIGMGLFAGDTVAAYLTDDYLSVAIHAIALVCWLFLNPNRTVGERE